MIIKKSIVLVILLVSFLTLAATSQISQVTDTISLEESKSCNTIFYNETENVFGYVTREMYVYNNCIYYYNYTHCTNSSGPNTDCSVQQISYNQSCLVGIEQFQNYEKTGTANVLKNRTECKPLNKFVVTMNKGSVTEKKEVDFSSWGVCINTTEDGCLAITCGTLQGGSARNGIFNGCDGGKSCQKFLFCPEGIKVLYKASRNDFVPYDPTFHLSPLALKGVGK